MISDYALIRLHFRKAKILFFTAIIPTLSLCFFLSACSIHKIASEKERYLIVIDPGFGQRYYRRNIEKANFDGRITEKEINLLKAKKLAEFINENSTFSAILTRNDNEFVPLNKRRTFPNMNDADIFIALQTIFSKDSSGYEVGSYCTGILSDEKARETASNANGASKMNTSDLNAIINQLIDDGVSSKSCQLSSIIHQNMVKKFISNGNVKFINEGTRKAPFYIFLGTKIPSVLIETSYFVDILSNKRDDHLSKWDIVCEGMLEGLESYIHKQKVEQGSL